MSIMDDLHRDSVDRINARRIKDRVRNMCGTLAVEFDEARLNATNLVLSVTGPNGWEDHWKREPIETEIRWKIDANSLTGKLSIHGAWGVTLASWTIDASNPGCLDDARSGIALALASEVRKVTERYKAKRGW